MNNEAGSQDLELPAMQAVSRALEPLTQDARLRVLHWSMAKFCNEPSRNLLAKKVCTASRGKLFSAGCEAVGVQL